MTALRRFVLFSAVLLPLCFAAPPDSLSRNIHHYSIFFGVTLSGNGDTLMTLRKFGDERGRWFLAVDPKTLQTSLLPAQGVDVHYLSPASFRQRIAGTPYGRAMKRERAAWKPRLNAGLRNFPTPDSGIHLTVDLCPSRRPLTRELFTTVIDAFGAEESPVPVSIAVTGVWMKQHPADLSWLLTLVKDGRLRIRWINHTAHHRYDRGLPASENFLLQKGTDVDAEVLGNERIMLEHGIIPSLFFRFPGLVSDSAVFARVTDYGLLPIGSDAWLAKGQKPREGSVVLVHGNGNEPIGVADFLELLREKRPLILQKRWLLLDIDADADSSAVK